MSHLKPSRFPSASGEPVSGKDMKQTLKKAAVKHTNTTVERDTVYDKLLVISTQRVVTKLMSSLKNIELGWDSYIKGDPPSCSLH